MTSPQDDLVTIHVARRSVTMHPGGPAATAVAVRGPRIVAVGSIEEVTAAVGRDRRAASTAGRGLTIAPSVQVPWVHRGCACVVSKQLTVAIDSAVNAA
ncbi:MAG: hypothetical protein OEU32_12840 [Acidimicrobiia bacterium]|nr:hypothetical protein [Acidimicrobiia bacterium]